MARIGDHEEKKIKELLGTLGTCLALYRLGATIRDLIL